MSLIRECCSRVTHPSAGRRQVLLPALPLDLHVLSLPLAFILSQDQTLLCIFFISLSLSRRSVISKEINALDSFVLGTLLYLSFNIFKDHPDLISQKRAAKITTFSFLANFFYNFFDKCVTLCQKKNIYASNEDSIMANILGIRQNRRIYHRGRIYDGPRDSRCNQQEGMD